MQLIRTYSNCRQRRPALWIVPFFFAHLSVPGQSFREYLPPLPSSASQADSISSSELRLLLPVTGLISWSHGASENPQNSRTQDGPEILVGPILVRVDPLLFPAGAAFHEENKIDTRNAEDIPQISTQPITARDENRIRASAEDGDKP
jgi:hypothetical protein